MSDTQCTSKQTAAGDWAPQPSAPSPPPVAQAPLMPTQAAPAPVDAPPAPAAAAPVSERAGGTYTLHSLPALEEAVQAGRVVIGKLAIYQRWGSPLAFVRSSRFPRDVVLRSVAQRAPALHGDIVAVELYPEDQWRLAAPAATDGTAAEGDAAAAAAGDAFDGAEPLVQPMPAALPDGRRVWGPLLKEDAAAASANRLPQDWLAVGMGAPSRYVWPDNRQPTGRVVALLHRSMKTVYVGRLASGARPDPTAPIQGSTAYSFDLYDVFMPQVVVMGRDIPYPFHETLEKQLFLLRLCRGPGGDVEFVPGDKLLAVISASVGLVDTVQANAAAIRATYGIRTDVFPDEVEALVPDAVDIPPTREGVAALGRRDLREDEFVCTIDPATARDLDDALSIRRGPHGGYHVGVHIADVSYFVEPGTAIDEEARERLTSTYFVDSVVPMLPRKLSEVHCSLNPSEDKYAFSCLFEMDREGHVVSEWFGRSIIRSRCRLAYEEAQAILDGAEVELDFGEEAKDPSFDLSAARKKVYDSVKMLFALASLRRRESLDRGRLTIGSVRLSFELDRESPQLAPRSFHVKKQIEANWLVEEFMLLANNRAAEKIVQFLPAGAMLRRHESPARAKMLALKEALANQGIQLLGSSAKALQATLDAGRQHACLDAMCEMMKLSLRPAVYFANDIHSTAPRSHFALGLPWYTHFTSPIRRYCDIMAHRQLLVALELEAMMKARGIELPSRPDGDVEGKPGDEFFNSNTVVDPSELEFRNYIFPSGEVELIADAANEAKVNARLAGEESAEVFLCLYLQALLQKAKVDPSIRRRQITTAVVLKLTEGSVTLYAHEIASQVQVALTSPVQRFTVVPEVECQGEEGLGQEGGQATRTMAALAARGAPRVDGSGREIDAKEKAARRRKGGKQGMPIHSDKGRSDGGGGGGGPSGRKTPTKITVEWRDPRGQRETEYEDFQLLAQLVVELAVIQRGGRTRLEMIVLPPWERAESLKSWKPIPTSLESEEETGVGAG